MKIRQRIFIGILFIFLILFGANYFMRPFEDRFDVVEKENNQVVEQVEPIVLTRLDILNKLSAEEKIAQMISYPLIISEEEDATPSANFIETGFFTIFGNNISSESAKQKIAEIEVLYADNLLSPKFVVDHEGGKVQRLNGEGYTTLPSWNDLCDIEDIDLRKILKESARELKSTGIDIVLAPSLDVGSSKVLKDRICSASYAVVADKSIEYTSIFDSFGILPVLKHFPGIGDTSKDLHNNFDVVSVIDNDAKLYKYVIEQSPRVGVMISHAGILNQDPEVPCSLSENCINELKNAYPYLLIFSDALEMKSASFNKDNPDEEKDLVRVSREAVVAGNEVLIYGQSVGSEEMEEIITALSARYEESTSFKELVDKAVLKIVDYKHAGR